MDFTISHEFDCDPERYWRVFFDEEYNQALYAQLSVKERRVLERRDEQDGAVIHRVIRILPQTELPPAIRKLLGSEIAYIERSTWKRAENKLDVSVTIDVPAARDRFDFRGTYTVASLAPTRVRREFRAQVKVSIPLLGGQVEKQVAEGIRKQYETATAFTRRWLAEHA